MTEGEKKEFTPRIVGFLCNWCTYAAADLAGSTKLEISPVLTVIRVMCSSRVDHNLVLTTFFGGADGILIAGCHPGDCHYIGGNYRTRRRMALLKTMLMQFGLNKDRFRLEWISAAEGEKFAAVVNEFVDTIIELGPSPYRKMIEEKSNKEVAALTHAGSMK